MKTAQVPIGGIDYDTHDYLVATDNGVVRDRRNLRPTSKEGKESGANVAINGTTSMPFIAVGEKWVGFAEDKERDAGIFFLQNTGADRIVRYYPATGVSDVILMGDFGFQSDKTIYADVIGDILGWTDYVNPPRKINLTRAISTSTDWLDKYTVYDEDTLSLNVPPPKTSPTWGWGSDATRKVNKMLGKSFQFSYQYIYKDNEISTISPLSSIAIPPSLFLNSEKIFVDENSYNYVVVTAETGNSEVKIVRLLAKEGNNGSWFIVKDYEKIGTDHNSDVSIVFANDVVRKYVSDDQSSTFYSDVPLLAKDIKAVLNRFVLAGVKKGYDSPSAPFDVALSYTEVVDSEPKVGTVTDGISFDGGIYDYYIKFTPSAVTAGEMIGIHLNMEYDQYRLVDGVPDRVIFYGIGHFQEEVLVGDTVESVLTKIAAEISADRSRLIHFVFEPPTSLDLTIETSVVGGSLYVYFRGAYSPSGSKDASFMDVPSYISNIEASGVDNIVVAATAVSSYKSGSYYNVAIEFLDRYGRTSGALNPQRIYVPFNSEREVGDVDKRVRIAFDVTGVTPPTWATHYRFMVSESVSYSAVFPFITSEAYDTVDGNRDVTAIRIPTETGYEFNDGDFLLYDDTSAITFQVITSKVGITIGSTDYDGIFILVPKNSTYNAAYYKGKVLSIHRPKDTVTETLFFEDFNTYTITGGAMDTITGYIDCGDIHLCFRKYDDAGGTEAWVEDFVADIPSGLRAYSKGRPMVVLSEFGEVELQDICWGGKYFDNTKINDLSFFKPLDRYQMNEANGKISRIVLVGDVLKVIQENKETSLYIQKGQITDANGNLVTVLTGEFIGAANASETDYGTKYPDSVVVNNRDLYYFDGDRGEVIRSSPNGQFPISKYNMASYFFTKKIELGGAVRKVVSFYDRKNEEYGISFMTSYDSDTLTFKEGENYWSSFWDYYIQLFTQKNIPHIYACIGNLMYSGIMNSIYEHETDITPNKFYGVVREPSITHVLNENAGIMKNIKAMSVDADVAPSIEITVQKSSTVPISLKSILYPLSFRSREGVYVSPVYRNIKKTDGTDDLSLLHNGLPMNARSFTIKMDYDIDGLIEFHYRTLELSYIPVR